MRNARNIFLDILFPVIQKMCQWPDIFPLTHKVNFPIVCSLLKSKSLTRLKEIPFGHMRGVEMIESQAPEYADYEAQGRRRWRGR